MAYSNVTPPALPNYDTAANPYAIVIFAYEIGAENWENFTIQYSATPFIYDPSVGIKNTGVWTSQLYTNDGWFNWGEQTEHGGVMPGPEVTMFRRIWTNHEIYDTNGNIYLEANTVTPLYEVLWEINVKSKLAGLIAAWCAPVRQFSYQEPVVPVEKYEAIFANGELYIKKAPAVLLGTTLSLAAWDQ